MAAARRRVGRTAILVWSRLNRKPSLVSAASRLMPWLNVTAPGVNPSVAGSLARSGPTSTTPRVHCLALT